MENFDRRERGSLPDAYRQRSPLNKEDDLSLLVSHDDLHTFACRIIVAGSRSYNNYDEFDFMMQKLLAKQDKSNCVIISGDALDGPDAMAIHWAKVNGWKYTRFPADWDKFKKAAGFIRNAEMKKHATRSIVFWDLESRGAEHMFNISNADKSIQTTLLIVHADHIPYR